MGQMPSFMVNNNILRRTVNQGGLSLLPKGYAGLKMAQWIRLQINSQINVPASWNGPELKLMLLFVTMKSEDRKEGISKAAWEIVHPHL